MITGAHVIVYSADAEADRAFLRDVLGLRGVDAGEGWLIFALPPAEVAVHPAEHEGVHELYLLTEDVAELVAKLRRRGESCTEPEDYGWGVLTRVTLPGGGHIGVYEPRHARP
jgi:catechol 2,3-dioxygenase-like lactoylglutathione lyase family enzyme